MGNLKKSPRRNTYRFHLPEVQETSPSIEAEAPLAFKLPT